jgi:ribonuclease D
LIGLDPGISYRALVAEFKGIEVPKDETQSDWLKRPLTDAQQEYAALDVVYLLEIGRELQNRVTELGRLDWLLEDGARMATGGKGPLAKFKSAWKLDSRQRSALAALVEWREERARDRDKPRSWIAPDKALTAIAQRLPESVNSLAALDGVPEPLARRQGRRLLDVVARAADGTYVTDWCPQSRCPGTPRRS